MQLLHTRPKLHLAPLSAVAVLAFASLGSSMHAQDNRLDPAFHAPTLTLPNVADKTFVLPDDRFYAYGGNTGLPLGFDRVAGEQGGGLLRFLADGTLDRSFRLDPSLAGYYVNAVSPTPDGRLVIAAARPFAVIPSLQYFYNIARFQVFRLNADGSRDLSFNSGSGTEPLIGDNEENGAAAFIRNVIALPDGKVLVGGQFRDFSGSGRSDLLRLNADGSVDPAFAAQFFRADTAFGGQPTGIAAGNQNLLRQPDGKIIVAGAFNELNGARRPGIARLNADGTLDASFVPAGFILAPDGDLQYAIRAVALQADGKIILGGPVANPADPGDLRPLVRLNADGSLDRLFDVLLDETTGEPRGFYVTFSLAPLADGRVVHTTAGQDVTLFNADGTVNSPVTGAAGLLFSTDPSFTGSPRLSLQSGGRIILSGVFDAIGEAPRPGGLARLLPAAVGGGFTLDPTFAAPGPLENNVGVDRLTLRADGGILVRGFFTAVDGQPRATLALLNADGSLNAQVPDSPDLFNEPLFAIANSAIVLPGDKTLLYGSTVDADFNFGFAYRRLNADGTPDATFQPDPTLPAFGRPLVQPDGKLLVSRGVIFNNEFITDGFLSNNGAQAILDGNALGRLNADGTVDDSFTFGLDLTGLIRRDPETKAILSVPNGDNRAVAVLPDGRILYKYFDGASFNLVRLLPDGALDETFQPGTAPAPGVMSITGFGLPFLNDPVTGESGPPLEDSPTAAGYGITNVLALPDGRLIVAGDFTSFNGVPAGGLVRLLANGQLDATFRVGVGAAFTIPTVVTGQNVAVDDVRLETDGKLLIVGSFDTFNGVSRSGIARLNFDGSVDTGFVPPVTARATGGAFSLALNNSLQPLPDGGFLLAGNFAASGDAPTAGPRSLFRLTADASRTPVLTVASTVPQTTEGSPTPGVVIVARAGDLSADLTVNYRVGGTASNGGDYTMLTGTRRMRPGVSTVKIKVRPVDDLVRDGAHNAKVILLPGDGYTVGDLRAAKVKILDND